MPCAGCTSDLNTYPTTETCRLAALPAVLRAARVDPLRALGADVALAAASEALLRCGVVCTRGGGAWGEGGTASRAGLLFFRFPFIPSAPPPQTTRLCAPHLPTLPSCFTFPFAAASGCCRCCRRFALVKACCCRRWRRGCRRTACARCPRRSPCRYTWRARRRGWRQWQCRCSGSVARAVQACGGPASERRRRR